MNYKIVFFFNCLYCNSEQTSEVAALRDDLANKNSTIQIIVTEKSELQSKSSYLGKIKDEELKVK